MAISFDLEKSFYEIQFQYLNCSFDAECQRKCSSKIPVGDQGWYYSPVPDYIGDQYSGIVVIGGNPAIPKDVKWNIIIKDKVINFLTMKNVSSGREMNEEVKKFIPLWRVVRNGVFAYERWGLKVNQIAYINSYKCRTKNNFNAFAKHELLRDCAEKYLFLQLRILKPKLIIYLWKTLEKTASEVWGRSGEWNKTPFIGIRSCCSSGLRGIDKENRAHLHEKIRENVHLSLNYDLEKLKIYDDIIENLFYSLKYGDSQPPIGITGLVDNGFNVDYKNKYGDSLLHAASWKDNVSVINELIICGANVNIINSDGYTPLHITALYNNYNVCKCLIDNGANINASDKYGQTPLHLAADRDYMEIGELLVNSGANINSVDKNGRTPVHLVSLRWSKRKVGGLLVRSGADLTIRDKRGFTAKEYARNHNDYFLKYIEENITR